MSESMPESNRDVVHVPILQQIRTTLAASVEDPSVDIVARMRALFYARYYDTPEAIEALKGALHHPSVLLRHEVAYVMGQMTQPSALPVLIDLLDNQDEHPMVRHEAGEGIAALCLTAEEAFGALKRHLKDPNVAVAETCYLALRGLERTQAKELAQGKAFEKKKWDPTTGFYIFTASNPQRIERVEKEEIKSVHKTYDPAEADEKLLKTDCVPDLATLIADESKDLWDRYVAMFTLREIGTDSAATALANALDEKSSALLRHEVCFVLGQMQKAVALKKLVERLEDVNEAGMVRHEAALALGSVGADIWSPAGCDARLTAIDVLEKWVNDPEPVVAESCVVGLSNIAWETGSLDRELRGY